MAVLRRRILLKLLVIFLGFICFTPVKGDQFENTNGLNSFGMPGEVDLPSAINLPDGQFSHDAVGVSNLPGGQPQDVVIRTMKLELYES